MSYFGCTSRVWPASYVLAKHVNELLVLWRRRGLGLVLAKHHNYSSWVCGGTVHDDGDGDDDDDDDDDDNAKKKNLCDAGTHHKEHSHDASFDDAIPLHVLELGAGVGHAAIAIAAANTNVHVTATDTSCGDPLVMQRLAENVAAQAEDSVASRIHVNELNWDDVTDNQHSIIKKTWNLVVGADLVYSKQGAASLCALLSRFAHSDSAPQIYLAHSTGRWGAFGYDEALLAELDKNQLTATPVGERVPGANDGEIVVVLSVAAAERGGDRKAMEDVLLRAKREYDEREKIRWANMADEERDEVASANQLALLFS